MRLVVFVRLGGDRCGAIMERYVKSQKTEKPGRTSRNGVNGVWSSGGCRVRRGDVDGQRQRRLGSRLNHPSGDIFCSRCTD